MKENKKTDNIGKKIKRGISNAARKLLLERARLDDYVIVSDKQGNPIKVKAKKLLKASR